MCVLLNEGLSLSSMQARGNQMAFSYTSEDISNALLVRMQSLGVKVRKAACAHACAVPGQKCFACMETENTFCKVVRF